MPTELDWAILQNLEKIGIAGVAVFAIYIGYLAFKLVLDQWKQSTEAVNKNTEAFTKLSEVFERQAEREVDFQKEVLSMLKDGQATIKDTNQKVTEIHRKFF